MATPDPARPMSQEEFAVIVKYSQKPLYGYAFKQIYPYEYKQTKDGERAADIVRHLAKDIAQDALIAAWENRGGRPFAAPDDAAEQRLLQASTFEELGEIRWWLFRVVHNLAVSACRADSRYRQMLKRYRHMLGQLSEEQPIVANSEQTDLSSLEIDNIALQSALERLPRLTRDCYILRTVYKLTEKEIGKSLSLSPQKVHERIRYASGRVVKAMSAARVHAPKGAERQ